MPIERVLGVSKVELYGVSKKQIAIRIDAARVAALHVDLNTLSQALQRANFSMTAGNIYEQEKRIAIKPIGEFQTIDEIAQLIIQPGILLKDIASVKYEVPKATEEDI